jgi:hypothetical protein
VQNVEGGFTHAGKSNHLDGVPVPCRWFPRQDFDRCPGCFVAMSVRELTSFHHSEELAKSMPNLQELQDYLKNMVPLK